MLLRGLNVVVLNEVTGAVMSSRWFDTYESKEDSGYLMEFLSNLKNGRIICFAVKVRTDGIWSMELFLQARNLRVSYTCWEMTKPIHNEPTIGLSSARSIHHSLLWEEEGVGRRTSCRVQTIILKEDANFELGFRVIKGSWDQKVLSRR